MGVFKRWHESKDGTKTPYWYYRLWHNGREIKRSVGEAGIVTKTQAKRVMEEKKRRLRLGQYDIIDARIPTLGEFAEEYVAYQRDVKQIRSHSRTKEAVNHFKRFYGNSRLTEITAQDVDVYKQRRLEEGVKPGTIKRELNAIRHLFNQARRWKKFFGDNPVSSSGMPEVHDQKERILSLEEEKKLLTACPGHMRDAVIIALHTDMRQAEILGLRWEWIDIEGGVITLPQTNTKSQKMRRVPINSVVRTVLLERKLASGGSDYVLPSPKGIEYHLNWVKRSYKTACKNAGIEGLRFHDLRHTAATRMVEGGVPLHAVAKLLGHSTIRITERYSHPEQSINEAVLILEKFNSNRTENRTSEKPEGA